MGERIRTDKRVIHTQGLKLLPFAYVKERKEKEKANEKVDEVVEKEQWLCSTLHTYRLHGWCSMHT